QAEDGIRDATVTGVQTCALPICENSRPGFPRKNVAPHHGSAWTNSASALGIREVLLGNLGGSRYTSKERDTETGNDDFGASYFRSEERRVGKECKLRSLTDRE